LLKLRQRRAFRFVGDAIVLNGLRGIGARASDDERNPWIASQIHCLPRRYQGIEGNLEVVAHRDADDGRLRTVGSRRSLHGVLLAAQEGQEIGALHGDLAL
jgi:hypothetical protein